MKPCDSLDCKLSKLASADLRQADFASFRSGVWREIRHRQAVESISPRSNLWQWGFLDFIAGRLGWASAFLAITVGVSLGILATNSRFAARSLGLEVFSSSASGLPSHFLASRK